LEIDILERDGMEAEEANDLRSDNLLALRGLARSSKPSLVAANAECVEKFEVPCAMEPRLDTVAGDADLKGRINDYGGWTAQDEQQLVDALNREAEFGVRGGR
jgi:hypothetical protein